VKRGFEFLAQVLAGPAQSPFDRSLGQGAGLGNLRDAAPLVVKRFQQPALPVGEPAERVIDDCRDLG
jgi:hypothetical protein